MILLTLPQGTMGAEALRVVAERSLVFRIINGIFATVAVLFVAGMLALFFSLKDVKRAHMMIATAFFAVAVGLFLGSTVVEYSLVRLSEAYLSATSDAQRAAYVATWELAGGVSGAGETLGQVLFSVSLIIVSSVMLKARGIFSKAAAYLSIVAGIVGLVASIPLPPLEIVSLASNIILAAWFLLVGYDLYKLG